MKNSVEKTLNFTSILWLMTIKWRNKCGFKHLKESLVAANQLKWLKFLLINSTNRFQISQIIIHSKYFPNWSTRLKYTIGGLNGSIRDWPIEQSKDCLSTSVLSLLWWWWWFLFLLLLLLGLCCLSWSSILMF